MRFGRMLLVVMLCLIVSAPSLAGSQPPPGAQPAVTDFAEAARRFLPGTWSFEYNNKEPAFDIVGTSTYHADGSADYAFEIVAQGKRIPFTLSADWRVEGNKMITVITASSAPAIAPIGERSVDTIHELSADVFHYTDDDEHITVKELRLRP